MSVQSRDPAAELDRRSLGRLLRVGGVPWVSRQSEELEDRSVLKRRAKEIEQRFKGQDVPFPPFWGGYRLIPECIEFWQGRLNRLHDRLLFTRVDGGWAARRLYP